MSWWTGGGGTFRCDRRIGGRGGHQTTGDAAELFKPAASACRRVVWALQEPADPPVSTYVPPSICTLPYTFYILYPKFCVRILQFLRMHPLAQENTGFEIGLPKQIGPQEFLTEVDSGSRTAVDSKGSVLSFPVLKISWRNSVLKILKYFDESRIVPINQL